MSVQLIILVAIKPELLKFEINEFIDILRFLNVVFVAVPHNIANCSVLYDSMVNLKLSNAKFCIVALLQSPKIALYDADVDNYKLLIVLFYPSKILSYYVKIFVNFGINVALGVYEALNIEFYVLLIVSIESITTNWSTKSAMYMANINL